MKLTLEVFLAYSYDLAYFHPDILIEAILIEKKRVIIGRVVLVENLDDLDMFWSETGLKIYVENALKGESV